MCVLRNRRHSVNSVYLPTVTDSFLAQSSNRRENDCRQVSLTVFLRNSILDIHTLSPILNTLYL